MAKQLKAAIWCMLVGLVIGAGGGAFGLFAGPERLLYDQRQRTYRAELAASDQILLVMIDEASLAALKADLGRFPWPRRIYADVLDFIALGEPRAVVFDILFSEPEVASGGESSGDERLAEASTALPTVHAARLMAGNSGAAGPDTSRFRVPGGQLPAGESAELVPPVGPLVAAAADIGFVDLTPDADGVVRRTPMLRSWHENVLPSLSGATLRAAGDSSIASVAGGLKTSAGLVPLAPDAGFDVGFYGHFKALSFSALVASAKQVYEGDVENLLVHPEEFKDKIVFIAASAAGLDDLRPNPLSAAAPGVHIHASVVSNVLTNDLLRRAPAAITFIVSSIVAAAIAIGVIFSIRMVWQVILPLGVLGTFVVVGFEFFRSGWIMELMPPLVSGTAAWFCSLGYVNVTHGRDRRKVRRMLAQYVSPSVLAAVVDKYEDVISAGVGAREHVTVLFSDVRSFTSMSESLQAEQVVDLLNVHFGVMTEIIFRYEGTLDKFIGDAIMAFWGAPLRAANHAQQAVRAALEMAAGIEQVNQALTARGLPQIRIGIGLNSGDVVLGNVGSERKLDYTVIGDNVNLASRMEGLTSKYGVAVLISESTYEAVKSEIACALVDRVRVKGKHTPIGIYAPLALLDGEVAQEAWEDIRQAMEQAFAHYSARQWDAAMAVYEQLPFRGVAELFLERCRLFKNEPPPPEWDGVTKLDSK